MIGTVFMFAKVGHWMCALDVSLISGTSGLSIAVLYFCAIVSRTGLLWIEYSIYCSSENLGVVSSDTTQDELVFYLGKQ